MPDERPASAPPVSDPLRIPLPGGWALYSPRGDRTVELALELTWRADARARSGDFARLRRTFAEPVSAGRGSGPGTTEPVDGAGSARFECVHAAEAARVLGLSSRRVRQMCDRGDLAASKSAGRWEIELGEVLAYRDALSRARKATA